MEGLAVRMVSTESLDDGCACRVVIRPNRSMSWRESMLFVLAVAALLTLVSVAFALQGLWMVLPFAGLEVAVLAYCTYRVSLAGYRCEVVSMDAARVVVEKGRENCAVNGNGGPDSSTSFPRAWTRVELKRNGGWYPDSLIIGASGKFVELGKFLADEEKRHLAGELQRLLLRSDG